MGETINPAAAGQRVSGLAIGASAPLVIRGKAPILGWAPSVLKPADGDLAPRLADLYGQTDPMLAALLAEGIETGRIASGVDIKARGGPGDPVGMEQMARGAARLIAHPEGPRVAALAFEGWDTHAHEVERLSKLLSGLDNALAAFEQELGPVWKDTAILVATEFGRTARINGTEGTDHGTATTAFLMRRRHPWRACHRRLARPQARAVAGWAGPCAHDGYSRDHQGSRGRSSRRKRCHARQGGLSRFGGHPAHEGTDRLRLEMT